MAIPFISRTIWLTRRIGTGTVAAAIGVSTRAVDYWMRAERSPTSVHVSAIERLYERTQYARMTARGLAPLSATKYRGLYPETFDIWEDRLSATLDKFTSGHVGARLSREGLTVDDLTRQQFQDMWEEEYERLLSEVDESGDDIEELEASP